MKKILTSIKTLTVFILLAANMVANAQTNTWTLVSGSDTSSSPAVYGVRGQFSDSANPGPRAISTTWVDADNNLWLFAGSIGVEADFTYKGDLWKYNIKSNQWAWINGSQADNPVGNYGAKGIASGTNTPPYRLGSSGWTDSAGNLWFFGGVQMSGQLNDVWKYNIDSAQWTWVNGSNSLTPPPVYGTKGIGAVTNTPGGRTTYAGWAGKAGLFWMFGGVGVDNTGEYGDFNDLWSYSTATNKWTWVSGDSLVSRSPQAMA